MAPFDLGRFPMAIVFIARKYLPSIVIVNKALFRWDFFSSTSYVWCFLRFFFLATEQI